MSDWSELPHELLVEIVVHINKLEDFFAFGAVCKSWCAARKKEYFKGLWLRQETPYLMLPVRDDNDNAREFYSLVEGEVVASVRIPKFKERKCHESLGWLLAVENDGSMCLLDPFSSVEIPVPQQRTFPRYEQSQIDEYVFVQKMVLSARPSETSNFILMILYGGLGHLGFWRPGDESWNRIAYRSEGGPYMDVMYYGGQFYAIDGAFCVRVFTIEGDKPHPLEGQVVTQFVLVKNHNLHARNINDVVWSDTFYVLKTSQSLFVISRTSSWYSDEDDRLYDNTCKFRVYEVEMSKGTYTEITSIGSMAIFVGHNTTFGIDTSRSFGKIKSNHIYFSDDGWESYHFHDKEGGGRDMGVYNLETGTIEPFYSGEVLLSKSCVAVWITPSLSF